MKFWLSLALTTTMVLTATGAGADGGQSGGEQGSAGPSEEVQARIERLEAELAGLDDNWLTQQRADEIRGLVHDVLADADSRASLADTGLTAGYDKFFFIQSPDGNFRLNIMAQLQVRYVMNLQDDDNDTDSTVNGFENSRTRMGFMGHIVDPSWQYLIWSGWTGTGQSWLVVNYIKKQFDNGLSAEFGHFKLPVWREWLISETRQKFPERSLLAQRFAGAGKGVRLTYRTDRVNLIGTYTDGSWTWNTPWSIGPDTTRTPMPWQMSTEYAVGARAEFLLHGSWSDYSDFQSWVGTDPLVVLSAAMQWQEGEYGTLDEEDEVLQYSIDTTVKFGGASLHAAYIGSHFENEMADRDEWGLMVQGGYFLNENWELIARLEMGDLDGAGTANDELGIITVGATRFWKRHNLKWTTDVGYGFEAVDDQWNWAATGWRGDDGGEEGQVVIRSQMQLLF